MGCGTSNVSGERQLEKKSSKRDRDEHARKLMKVESKLGSKKIVNSFVVATAKAKARKRDTYNVDHQDPAFAKASADGLFWPSDSLGIVKETFALPAENANVAEPDLLGVTTSGPSFKMARGGSSSTKKRQHMTDEELEAAEAQKEVDRFKENLYKDDEDSIMEAATYFRERLSVTNAPVSEIRMMGVVPRLIALLSRKSARIQHEAAWAITNICSADHQDCQDVVDQGAVPALVNVLSTSKDSDVLQQVIWALGNIAADSRDMQQAIFDDGVLDPVLQCMQGRHTIHAPHAPHAPSTSSPGQQPDSNDEEPVDNQTAVTRQAAWLLSNMCRPRPPDNSVYRALSVFETLLGAIKDSEALTHLCWTLAYISNSEEGLEKLASNQFILKQLLQWLRLVLVILPRFKLFNDRQ
ncbi:hypothetical protein CEUSTIGMA_g7538.t1 [Chlamydomonas eustigma]|uniref:IBB domain-containing protein n=1 Tax=Chlamydomonas eustigma TaxID=1157962 RepID=A0A250XBF6_9CHLO|nr:hypothetical protein CEUSTIGMA_g7538.t1 [Chlamydomonas eustigma]|eukprot:GAX80100.1 hypothetical protein CEUSTIGMA_g7538.t1 [Chlamydomonas eustigma]